jgi:hypothetical protein
MMLSRKWPRSSLNTPPQVTNRRTGWLPAVHRCCGEPALGVLLDSDGPECEGRASARSMWMRSPAAMSRSRKNTPGPSRGRRGQRSPRGPALRVPSGDPITHGARASAVQVRPLPIGRPGGRCQRTCKDSASSPAAARGGPSDVQADVQAQCQCQWSRWRGCPFGRTRRPRRVDTTTPPVHPRTPTAGVAAAGRRCVSLAGVTDPTPPPDAGDHAAPVVGIRAARSAPAERAQSSGAGSGCGDVWP